MCQIKEDRGKSRVVFNDKDKWCLTQVSPIIARLGHTRLFNMGGFRLLRHWMRQRRGARRAQRQEERKGRAAAGN